MEPVKKKKDKKQRKEKRRLNEDDEVKEEDIHRMDGGYWLMDEKSDRFQRRARRKGKDFDAVILMSFHLLCSFINEFKGKRGQF